MLAFVQRSLPNLNWEVQMTGEVVYSLLPTSRGSTPPLLLEIRYNRQLLSYIASVTIEDVEIFSSTNKSRIDIDQALQELRSFLENMSGLIDGGIG
jgi:hypothetical protein